MVSVFITGAMCLALLGYTAYISKRRQPGSHCHVYGPTYFVVASLPLILADPLRHVLMDYGALPDSFSMYRDDCDSETVACLSVAGVFITIVCTYLGFTLLFIGSLWSANICDKCRELRVKWSELRSEDPNVVAAAKADEETEDLLKTLGVDASQYQNK